MGRNNPVLNTLLYSDIFDYPLTKQEIWRFLISPQKINQKLFTNYLSNIRGAIGVNKNLYFLKGREKIVEKRLFRTKLADQKIEKAKKMAKILSLIPSIKLIAISGSLAMKNSEQEEDIDFFVITGKNSIWLTRLMMILFLKFFGKYRSRLDKNLKDKICLNMFLSEKSLEMPEEMQNLFVAHEIIQLLPILSKGDTYQKFMSANSWVAALMSNSLEIKRLRDDVVKNKFSDKLMPKLLSIFESSAEVVQMRSIKKHRTIEKISDKMLAFHPTSFGTKVLKDYKKRMLALKNKAF